MNKHLGVAVLLGILAPCPAFAGGTSASCGWLHGAMNKAIADVTSTVSQPFEQIPQQSGSAIRRCLSQISSIGGGMDWEVPSSLFSSLLNQACTISTDAVNSAMNTYINQNVSYPGLVSANVGAGAGGQGFNVQNDSSSVANTLWQKALGNNVP
ncbi:MAG: hypothetical protein ACYDBH_02975 [Acidobacteriaceae bacterium]